MRKWTICSWFLPVIGSIVMIYSLAGCSFIPPVVKASGLVDTSSNQPNQIINNEIAPALHPTPSLLELRGIEQAILLDFPAPAESTVKFWRPPLYPIPWALTPHDHFYFQHPSPATNEDWSASNYQYGNLYPEADIVHTGIDFIADQGSPVLAAAGGSIFWVGTGLDKGPDGKEDPYGIAIVIRHDYFFNHKQIYTVYAHLDKAFVKLGQKVMAGDQIGAVGTTGFTTGPHLHFEVRLQEGDFQITRNPDLWLAPPQGWGVLTGALLRWNGTYAAAYPIFLKSLATGKEWRTYTYASHSVHSDDHYKENFVFNDLPAGDYEFSVAMWGRWQRSIITINPGQITYLSFKDGRGFSPTVPQELAEELDFHPYPTNP